MRYVLVAAVLVAGCQREERRFHVPEATARPVTVATVSTLLAGEAPVDGIDLDPAMPGYMETAYDVSQGHTLYRMFNCIGCHAGGGGAIGPPFIDSTWRYGSTPYDIAMSIVAGRPHGMPSFRGKLVSQKLYQLVAYVRSLGGFVRGDALPGRTDHLHAIPPPNLDRYGLPVWPKEGR